MSPANLERQTQTQTPALVDADKKVQAISRALRRAARKASVSSSIVTGGGSVHIGRRDRAFRRLLIGSFIACVAIPTVVASVYWGLIASRQYSTEMKFAVRSGESASHPGASSGMLSALAGAAGGSQDSQIVVDYVRSRAIVEEMESAVNLRRMFSSSDIDYFSRFDPSDPVEELEKYWRKHVDAHVETVSGIISVNVRAFTPEDSLTLGSTIATVSEKLVNDLSTRSRRDALQLASTELRRAEQRLVDAIRNMRDTRNAEGVLDATAAATALGKVITELQLEQSKAEQDLASLGAASRESPQARVLRARIASLKAQISDYSRQIAGGDKSDGVGTMANRAGELSRTQVEMDLMRQQYAQAAAALESARLDMETQRAYLVSFLKPTLAQKSTYPRRWWEWSTIVFPCLLVWGLFAAGAFLVRDHMAK